MTAMISSPFCSRSLQVGAEDLYRQFAFDAAHGLFHVVGNGLREAPGHAGDFLHFVVHGLDQQFFAAAKLRAAIHCAA